MTNPEFLKELPKPLWPKLIRTIAEVIGDEAALTFFIKLNGKRFQVPTKCHDSHSIVKAIGQDKADLLCQQFKQEFITIPKGATALRLARNRKIIADFKSGMTNNDLVEKYGLCGRQIIEIVYGPKDKKNAKKID